MKKFATVLLTLVLLCSAGLSAVPGTAEETPAHVLVVYFSHAGENYAVGLIEEGNTARMGRIIAEQMNADVFELVPVVPYSEVYDEVLDQATQEQRSNARPAYEGEIGRWEQYDTVFIGFPIWWGEIPNIVYTFMDSYDFTGKTVIPFNTHEGSGQARSQRDMTDYLPAATVLKGLAVRGSRAQSDAEGTAADVASWLKDIGQAQ